MPDSMFLHPRDLVEIYDQKRENSEQRRSHVVGFSEVNGIEVISNFYAFLVKNGIVPEAVRPVVREEADIVAWKRPSRGAAFSSPTGLTPSIEQPAGHLPWGRLALGDFRLSQ